MFCLVYNSNTGTRLKKQSRAADQRTWPPTPAELLQGEGWTKPGCLCRSPVKIRQEISPQVNSEWGVSLPGFNQNQDDKPNANSDTKIHCIRETGELGRASMKDPGMKCKAATGELGFRHQQRWSERGKTHCNVGNTVGNIGQN